MNFEPPIFVFDDDDWLYIHHAYQEFLNSIEWPFVEELTLIVDATGQPIAARPLGHGGKILQGTPIDITQIYLAVDRFFTAWTQSAPPAHLGDLGTYLAEVERQVASAPQRHRKLRY